MKRAINLLVLFLLFCACAASSFADSVKITTIVPRTSSYGVPRTGQAISYDGSNLDDGGYRMGAPAIGSIATPTAQYTDNNDNTITDNGTGLIWIKDPSAVHDGSYDFSNPMILSVAFLYVTNLNHSGGYPPGKNYTDWRVPNIKELESLIQYGQGGIYMDQTAFGINQWLHQYWSSTRDYAVPNYNIRYVDLNDGTVDSTTNANLLKYVRPVRGGIGGIAH